jgi:hypothetical protein
LSVTPNRPAIRTSETPSARHARARATCADDNFGRRPRTRTSPAEPSRCARPRNAETYTELSPITSATRTPAKPNSVNITTTTLRIPMSSLS